MITQNFKFWYHDYHDTTKTLSIANQSAVSIEQNVSVTFLPSKETRSSYFKNPFATADNKYSIFGLPFLGKYIQIIHIQVFTMNFKRSLNAQPTTASSIT